ncbi:cytochrome P450 [Nonomuraea muscovyensis]|uniref:Cytochrome P450 n=1 Tax=Nonomuraea muscovyensis TaxID=1124761 RepID=A0A7X0C3F2_9ACTN|nr:cytochrome P450 [Nonomuraea muscovyensis]MBB6347784.1 cytochrome P450 [Nonomuraea muscovyensis]MDF2704684.1 eryF2 [Nonomuraea muscovyensis]
MTRQTLPPKFDAFDPEVLDDPYPTYARLREAGALCRGGPATWVVTRHAEVAGLLRDERAGHTFPEGFRTPFAAAGGTADRLLTRIVSSLDPPDHTRIRKEVGRALNPTVVRGLRDRLTGLVDSLLAGRTAFDAVGDLALPLQIAVGCDLIGVPEGDREEVWPKAMALGRAFIPMAASEEGMADDGAARWLDRYVRELLADRRRRPGDDVLSRLAGRLPDDEIVDNAIFLLFAGFETAMYLVTSGLALLTRFPGQLARLKADRSLLPTAVEEIVRYDAPIQSMARMVREPISLGGRTVKPGRALLLLIGSANHDALVFPDPGTFDVGRRPNPHLAFGGGAHHCLGVALARLEGQVVLERLLTRFAEIEAAGPPVRRLHPNLRGYASVPLTVRPA